MVCSQAKYWALMQILVLFDGPHHFLDVPQSVTEDIAASAEH